MGNSTTYITLGSGLQPYSMELRCNGQISAVGCHPCRGCEAAVQTAATIQLFSQGDFTAHFLSSPPNNH